MIRPGHPIAAVKHRRTVPAYTDPGTKLRDAQGAMPTSNTSFARGFDSIIVEELCARCSSSSHAPSPRYRNVPIDSASYAPLSPGSRRATYQHGDGDTCHTCAVGA
jgi:hypothetical protein